MDIVQRLTAFRDHIGLTNSQFADRALIPRPTLSQFLSGRNKRMSDDLASKLHTAYPELNMLWLLFGEGDMLKTANIEFSEGKNPPNREISQPHSVEYPNVDHVPPIQTATVTPGSNLIENSVEASQSAPGQGPAPNQQISSAVAAAAAESEKKIQSIMVFYTDNSYEAFYPAPTD